MLAHLPALRAVDLHYDDGHSLVRNPHLRDLGNLPRFFPDPSVSVKTRQTPCIGPSCLVAHTINQRHSTGPSCRLPGPQSRPTWARHLAPAEHFFLSAAKRWQGRRCSEGRLFFASSSPSTHYRRRSSTTSAPALSLLQPWASYWQPWPSSATGTRQGRSGSSSGWRPVIRSWRQGSRCCHARIVAQHPTISARWHCLSGSTRKSHVCTYCCSIFDCLPIL